MHSCVHTYTYTFMHTNTHTYTTVNTYTSMHTHSCAHTYTHSLHTCTHVHTYTRTHIHIIHTNSCAHVYTHTHSCAHIHMHACTHAHQIWQLLRFQIPMRDRERRRASSIFHMLQQPWAVSSLSAVSTSVKPVPNRRPQTRLGSRLSSAPCCSGPCHRTARGRCGKARLSYTWALSASAGPYLWLTGHLRQVPRLLPAHLSWDTFLTTANRHTSDFYFHHTETPAPPFNFAESLRVLFMKTSWTAKPCIYYYAFCLFGLRVPLYCGHHFELSFHGFQSSRRFQLCLLHDSQSGAESHMTDMQMIWTPDSDSVLQSCICRLSKHLHDFHEEQRDRVTNLWAVPIGNRSAQWFILGGLCKSGLLFLSKDGNHLPPL